MKRLLGLALVFAVLTASARAEDPGVTKFLWAYKPKYILRVMPDAVPPNLRLPSLTFIGGYQTIDAGIGLNADQIDRLAAAIKAPGAFDKTEPEAKMRPGVSYRFGEGADAIDMLVCFSCDKIVLVGAGKDEALVTAHIAQPTRDVLLGLAKELLPKDEAIQELPKTRSTNAAPAPAVPVPEGARKPQPPSGPETQ